VSTGCLQVGLAPHVYPSSISGWEVESNSPANLTTRLDLSWGTKALGAGARSDVSSAAYSLGAALQPSAAASSHSCMHAHLCSLQA
jgi:hypothetical protein